MFFEHVATHHEPFVSNETKSKAAQWHNGPQERHEFGAMNDVLRVEIEALEKLLKHARIVETLLDFDEELQLFVRRSRNRTACARATQTHRI